MSEGLDVRKVKRSTFANKNTSQRSISDLLNTEINIWGRKLSDVWKEKFYSELYLLLSSGLDLQTSLDLILEEQTKEKEIALVAGIKERVIEGADLFKALKDTGKFSAYEYYTVQIGEESGRIEVVLDDLALYHTYNIKQRRQLISALSYPLIVLTTAVLAIAFMFNFIVPMFADVFLRFGGDLPTVTKVVLSISVFIQQYFGWALVFIVTLAFILYHNRSRLWYRRATALLLLKIPVVGELVRKTYMARFCQVMSLLSAANVPLLRSVRMVSNMIEFYPIEESLEQVEKDIIDGNSLYFSLGKFSIYDTRMVSLVQVGEEVNKLAEIFQRLAKQYTADVEHSTSMLNSVLEPLLIIILAFVVGLILIAMYLPMFSLSNDLFS